MIAAGATVIPLSTLPAAPSVRGVPSLHIARSCVHARHRSSAGILSSLRIARRRTARMALASGIHRLGPHNASLQVKTYREGMAAKVGHNVIHVTRWDAT